MSAKSQKFNASINFGASVDPSMTRTLNRLTSGIDHIGTESQKTAKIQTAWMRNLQTGSASTTTQIKNMERATQALTHKQASLEKEIRDSVKNGRAGVAFLVDDYKKVTSGVERARKEMEKLNAQQERETKLAEKEQRRQQRHDARWGKAASVSESAMTGGSRALLGAPLAIAGAGIAGITGLVGGAIALNKKTAEEYRLSQQYGMSYRNYKTGSILAEQAGLNGENFGDLSEELSNKLGTKGNDKSLNEVLAQIGLNKTQLKGTKEEQFTQVMQAITANTGKGKGLNVTQASSIADQLMGGEANKLVTYIINTQRSFKQAMENAAEINNVTEDEARAAAASSQVISNIMTSGETALQGMAGELGKAFEPQLKEWEKQATQWISNNKQLVVNEITDWVKGGGPKRVVDGLEKFGNAVGAVVNFINKFIPDDTASQQELAKHMSYGNSMESGRAYAKEHGIEDWFDKQHFDDPAVIAGLREKEGLASLPGGAGADNASPSVSVPINRNQPQQTNHVNIVVNAAEGQSPEEVGQTVYQKFRDGTSGDSLISPSSSAAYDPPQF